jgi:hypothetical protein
MFVRSSRSLYWTLAICALIFSVTLTYPFNNDNALYAYMADLALHGHLPYIGSWDQNFPAIVAIHALQIVVCGHSQLAFHVFDILLQLIGSALLFKLGTTLYNERAGMLAAILCALYYVQSGLWMAGERDTYVTILLIATILLARRGDRPIWVGVLLGIMILFRPTYGLYAPIFIVVNFFGGRKNAALKIVAGVILLIALVVLCYWVIGGLRDLWEATILFNFRIYAGRGDQFDLWEPIRFYAISIVAVAVAVYYFWRKNPHALMLWALLFLASIGSLLLLYRHSVYHYHPAMTLFLLMSAIGWARMAEWKNWTRALIPPLVIIFFFFQSFRGNTSQRVLRDVVTGQVHSVEQCYSYYEASPTFGVQVQTDVANYLKQHTHENDTVQMFGPYSFPQYAAGLSTASRFQTLHALAMRGAAAAQLQDFQIRWRAEYLNDMQRKRPIYFIVCDAPEAFRQYYGGRLGHEILRDDFQQLGRWLDSNYSPETKIGAFTLYHRH